MSELTLTAGGGGAVTEYTPPPVGAHKAILVDIILSKGEQTKFGVKDLLFFYFELDAKMEDGRPFLVRKKFTNSLNEKSNLYKFLTKWRGKPFEPGEEFNLRSMLGVGCVLEMEEFRPEGEDKVVVYVDRARKLAKKDWIKPSGEYDGDKARERIEAKKEENNSAQPAYTVEKGATDDFANVGEVEDDVPF